MMQNNDAIEQGTEPNAQFTRSATPPSVFQLHLFFMCSQILMLVY